MVSPDVKLNGTRSPEQAEDTREFGLILSEVTDEILGGVLRIYDEVNGGQALRLTTGAGFREQLELGFPGLRYGSKYSIDTKLFADEALDEKGQIALTFRCFTFVNREKPLTKNGREILRTQDAFKKAVSDYLRDTGVGTPITPRRY